MSSPMLTALFMSVPSAYLSAPSHVLSQAVDLSVPRLTSGDHDDGTRTVVVENETP